MIPCTYGIVRVRTGPYTHYTIPWQRQRYILKKKKKSHNNNNILREGERERGSEVVGGREGASSAATTMVARRARAGARVGRFRARARRCSFRAARVVSSSFAICRVQRHGIARIRGFSRSRPPRERNAHETAAAAASAGTCPRRRRRRRMSRRGRTRSAIKGPGRRTTGNSPRPIDKPYAPHVLTQCSPTYRVSAVLVLQSFIVFWISVFTATTTTYHSAMAYLSHSFDFEHMQNSTNWDAVQKKRSFVARKIHKINKVSVVFLEYQYYILLQFFFRLHRKLKTHSSARLTDLFFFCFVQTIKPILRALCRRNAVTPSHDGSALDPQGLSPEELENLQNEYIERKLSQAVVYDEDDYYSDTTSVESGLGLSFEELRQPTERRQLIELLPEARLYMSRDFWFESDARDAGRPSFTRQQKPQRQQPKYER